MRVECPSCGRFVDVTRVPAHCPACSALIEDLAPRVLVYRQGGHRLEPPRSPSETEQAMQSLAAGEARGPADHLPPAAPPYPIARPPRATREMRTALIALGAIACIVVVYILVDYVRLKTSSPVATSQSAQPAAPPAAPAPTARAPQVTPPASTPPPSIAPQATPPQSAPPHPAGPQSVPPPPEPSAAVRAQSPAPTAPPPAVEKAPAQASLILHPLRPPAEQEELNDAMINASIDRAVTYLIGQFDAAGLLRKETAGQGPLEGRHALAALALVYANQSTLDERLSLSGQFMTRVLQQLKDFPIEGQGGGPQGAETYTHAIRLMALAVSNRQADRGTMERDLDYLMKAVGEGGYTYANPPGHEPGAPIGFDNSNSQYGALGAWAAADAGLHVSTGYWKSVEDHWTNTQCDDGGWGYGPKGGSGYLAMTAAGVTMLFVAHDQLLADHASVMLEQAPYPPALERGLRWLAAGDNAVTLSNHPGYTLYGLERAGLASGFKRFGRHDWYRELAEKAIASQEKDGSWANGDGPVAETAFHILFLVRGRHPLMMNKLRFDGAWANRPRDLAKLSEFVLDSIERPVNWQVASLENDWPDWMDSPILYIASHDAVPLTDQDLAKLASYAEAGGLIFTQADADSRNFNAFAEELAHRLFPRYPMQDVPEDHLVYSTLYPMRIKPPLRAVSNGSRLLMIHSPTDLSAKWQFRPPDRARPQFELGANIFVYATGKHALRNRLDTPFVPEPTNPPIARVAVARVTHDGNWDPEPGAWKRFGRWFARLTSIELEPRPLEPQSLDRQRTPLAHLTTTNAFTLDAAQQDGLRRYVESGGVLLVDICGGNSEVADLVRTLVLGALRDPPAHFLAVDDPLVNASGEGMINLGEPRVRVYTVDRIGPKPAPMEVFPLGKGCVIFSRLDVTSGLLDTTTWGILGYEPQYAQQFMNNLVLWTVNGRGLPKSWTSITTQPAAR